MYSATKMVLRSKATLWAGRILTAITVLFMLFDGISKVAVIPPVVKAMAELGYPADLTRVLGVLILLCTVVYVIPRTSVLGAILLTAFLGGATAAKVRLEDPTLFFSVAMGVLVWAGLFFRDDRLRTLFPLRK
jgi:hypothetical protein